MGMLNFEPQVCGKIRGYIGHYLNSELLVETNIEVLQHLSYCQSCATFIRNRFISWRDSKKPFPTLKCLKVWKTESDLRPSLKNQLLWEKLLAFFELDSRVAYGERFKDSGRRV